MVDSNELLVTFTEGVYTNGDQTGALEINDFLLVDRNDDNAKTIIGVLHTAGEATATLTVSAPLIVADFGATPLQQWVWPYGITLESLPAHGR